MEKRYFYGNEISEYGVKNNRIDFRALAKCFDGVLCNNIGSKVWDCEIVSGEEYCDFFQFFIVGDNALSLLEEAHQTVWYDAELDVYIWGVTHYGTGWDYVLTDIKIDNDKK